MIIHIHCSMREKKMEVGSVMILTGFPGNGYKYTVEGLIGGE